MIEKLDFPLWYSLTGEHSYLAQAFDHASQKTSPILWMSNPAQKDFPVLRYPKAVAPFAAARPESSPWSESLSLMMDRDEDVVLVGETVLDSDVFLRCTDESFVDQMVYTENSTHLAPFDFSRIQKLGANESSAMLSLTQRVFPGYFREETWKMGEYFGIVQDGKLLAMAGERMVVPPWKEISSICTEQGYQGRGYASLLTQFLVKKIKQEGLIPFLHVGSHNQRAQFIYQKQGFRYRKTLPVRRYQRCDDSLT